ncbi:MAG TPA: hypothetical protein VGL61_22415 [Kofleriaceae bacterium]|jgi:hypothetical protein
MKGLLIVALVAACGSSNPTPAAPVAPAPTAAAPAAGGLLGLGEIAIKDSTSDVMRIHANGDVEFNDKGAWKPIAKLGADGKMTTSDNQSGQLQADGTFTTPEGPAPFKLDGNALVIADKRITIENGKIVGGNDSAASITVSGADNDGQKRTALLLLGLLMSPGNDASSAGSAVSAPPTK